MIDTDDVKNRRYEILGQGDPCVICLIKPICDQSNKASALCDKKLEYNYAQTIEMARLVFIEGQRKFGR